MTNEIFNLKLRDYLKADPGLQESYYEVLQYLKGCPKLGKLSACDITALEYGKYIELRNLYFKGDFLSALQMIKIVFGFTSDKKIMRQRIIPFFKALNYIQEELDKTLENESKALSSKPTQRMRLAGVDRFNKFQELNVLSLLAKAYNTQPQEVNKWEYKLIFALLYLDSEEKKYEIAYQEIDKHN